MATRTILEKVTDTALSYYRQADTQPTTLQEVLAWFNSLTNETQAEVLLMGPVVWPRLASLKRFVLETRGCSMAQFMRQHLTKHELTYWVDERTPSA